MLCIASHLRNSQRVIKVNTCSGQHCLDIGLHGAGELRAVQHKQGSRNAADALHGGGPRSRWHSCQYVSTVVYAGMSAQLHVCTYSINVLSMSLSAWFIFS